MENREGLDEKSYLCKNILDAVQSDQLLYLMINQSNGRTSHQ